MCCEFCSNFIDHVDKHFKNKEFENPNYFVFLKLKGTDLYLGTKVFVKYDCSEHVIKPFSVDVDLFISDRPYYSAKKTYITHCPYCGKNIVKEIENKCNHILERKNINAIKVITSDGLIDTFYGNIEIERVDDKIIISDKDRAMSFDKDAVILFPDSQK